MMRAETIISSPVTAPFAAIAAPVGFGLPCTIPSMPCATMIKPAMPPTVDYWGPQWAANTTNYQWEVQNIRQELDWTYKQLQFVDSDRQGAQHALEELRSAQAQWAAADWNARNEMQNERMKNATLANQLQIQHNYAGEAYERLKVAERNWHSALRTLENQRIETMNVHGQLQQVTADAEMSKAGLLEQLNWHRQQLARAQQEIRRIRPCESQFTAVTSEVEYLRAQTAQMRQLEERFASVCREAEMLRAQLVKQEHNIDRYAHQTESFYQSANTENVSVKKQLQAREDELRHLRERFKDAVDEINHSHDQVLRAEAEIKRLRLENDELHDYASETTYLKDQVADQADQIAHLEDRLDGMGAESDTMRDQLGAADAEIERLHMALSDKTNQHRFLEAALSEEIADNKAVRRQLNEAVVHQQHVASALKSDAAALSNDANVKQMELERLQKRLAETTAELDKYTAMYQEAVIDVDRLKAALTEEIADHKYAKNVAEQQKRKADMAIEELERLGDGQTAQLRARLADYESEMIHLKNVIEEHRLEIDRLRDRPQVREIVHDPVTVGWNRGEPIVKPGTTEHHVHPQQHHAYFGVEVAEGAFLSKTYGESRPIPAVRVVNVSGPCQEAGLKPGDLISSIKGRQVGSLEDFNAVVSIIVPHSEVKIIFERDGVLLGTDIVTEESRAGGAPHPDDKGRRSSASDSVKKASKVSSSKPGWKK